MSRFESLYMNTLVWSALKISKLSEIILCPSRAPATYNSWLRHCWTTRVTRLTGTTIIHVNALHRDISGGRDNFDCNAHDQYSHMEANMHGGNYRCQM